MFMYSETFQGFGTFLLVSFVILLTLQQQAMQKAKTWIRFLLQSGQHAGVAVEGRASLRWIDAHGNEHNVKGEVWLEPLYGGDSDKPSYRLVYDGINLCLQDCAHAAVSILWSPTTERKQSFTAQTLELEFSNCISARPIEATLQISC